jgi:ABC-type multidrug transport system ATPase subunit
VFGCQPRTKGSGIPGSRLGYQPQDLSLYEIFTIKEILEYFGKIYNMQKEKIKARTEFLISFLGLSSSTSKYIKDLSGGQKRRVSFAIAIIHEPQLLILDEPTVGLDPLKRTQIWSHLIELSRRGTTILISSHYIEEARNAHRVSTNYIQICLYGSRNICTHVGLMHQ